MENVTRWVGRSLDDVGLFFSTLEVVFCHGIHEPDGAAVDIGVSRGLRKKYAGSFSRLMTGMRLAAVRFYAASTPPPS